jgi:hypothetical protein
MAKRTTRSTTPKAARVSESADKYTALVEPSSVPAGPAVMDGANNRADSMASEPSEEEIRMRAYRRYLDRGGSHGKDFDDWLQAERELKSGV